METKEIIKLYKERFGTEPKSVVKMAGAGSSRRYYLLERSDGASTNVPEKVVGTYGDDPNENSAFCDIANMIADVTSNPYWFSSQNPMPADPVVRVPEIYSKDEKNGFYLQSYHGERSLMDEILECRRLESKLKKDAANGIVDDALLRSVGASRERVSKLVDSAIVMLVELQNLEHFDADEVCAFAKFGNREIKWDLNYFKYDFLKPLGVEFDEGILEHFFDEFTHDIMEYHSDDSLSGFMYRDYQSRNIMVEGDKITLIDFQGGRLGPVIYDIISLLWQAKAAFDDNFRQEKLNLYFSLMENKRGKEAVEKMRKMFDKVLLLRTLQVLGAYGFRGLVERKSHFLESIYYGLRNLEEVIRKGLPRGKWYYSDFEKIANKLIAMKSKFAPRMSEVLRVEVFSFSYKKGYPLDYSGNGGGFMFDCRGMHNPGRYEEYKLLTGLDAPVIEFLEERGEVQEFVKNAFDMVAPSIDTYVRRGFNNLQIGFGCTGGQHRSVYCAEHLAEEVATAFPEIEVVVEHRERGIKREVERK